MTKASRDAEFLTCFLGARVSPKEQCCSGGECELEAIAWRVQLLTGASLPTYPPVHSAATHPLLKVKCKMHPYRVILPFCAMSIHPVALRVNSISCVCKQLYM